MTAARGSGKTAEELLGALLTDAEHIAILQYASEHDLKKDDVVYFMVGLLKVFAFVHDKILRAIDLAQEGQSDLEAAVIMADQNLTDSIERQVQVLRQSFTHMNGLMGTYAGQLAFTAGEIKSLNQELERLTKEARGTYGAFKRLSDDNTGASLSQLFQKQAAEALNHKSRYFDETIRTLIAQEARKLLIFNIVQFVVLTILLLGFR